MNLLSGILKYIDVLLSNHTWRKPHFNCPKHVMAQQKVMLHYYQYYMSLNIIQQQISMCNLNLSQLAKEFRSFKSDKRFSGSCLIDDELQDLIHLSLRDFVENWYSTISDDKEFVFEFRKTLKSIFIMISSKYLFISFLISETHCAVQFILGVKKLIG